MNIKKGSSRFLLFGAATLCALLVLTFLFRKNEPMPAFESLSLTEPASVNVAGPLVQDTSADSDGDLSMADPVAEPLWNNNSGQLTPETKRLVEWVESGRPLDVRIGESESTRYGFRSLQVTSDDFRLSKGVDSEMAADHRVFSGRELLANGELGETASLAVVNGAVSLAITRDGQNYLIETDPETGELYALNLHNFSDGHVCGESDSSCASGHVTCSMSSDERLASTIAPMGVGADEPVRVPVALIYPGEILGAVGDPMAADEPVVASTFVDHPFFRHGAEYTLSLPDILVVWASSKSQTGTTSGLSSRAASYFSIAARTADVYERQLGLRYLLQELILIPSDSAEEDPGDPSTGSYTNPDLDHWAAWLSSHRPQSTYKWGHAALWTVVDGGSGGVIGQAWVDAYGYPGYAHSVQERNWGWEVHSHEMGHNVGSSHTSGGVMNPSLQMGNEDFFTIVSGQAYTAAKDIYNWMGTASRAYVFGYGRMRHPEEMPFGMDDSVSTALNTPVSFSPLANDKNKVVNGAVNTLRLVEVGRVFPIEAGTAVVDGDQIQFTPATNFTGQAWFSYTLGGDVGNSAKGWLHSADVILTVGGDSTPPSLNPVINLVDDLITSDLSSMVRINPLLNDEGKGRLWTGDVHVVLGPNDTTEESYSDHSFRLVGASILTGTGAMTMEQRYMTRSGSPSLDNTGYISYYPGTNEGNEVVIEYTVMDADGVTATAQIIILRAASVGVEPSTSLIVEPTGDVAAFIFQRAGNVDTSIPETIDFTVTGSASPFGLRADYALAGQSDFDPVTGSGTIVIPEGQTDAFLYAAVLDDGVEEEEETVVVSITGTSSLPVSAGKDVAALGIRDNTLLLDEAFSSFTSNSATWSGWTNLANNNPSGKGGEDDFDLTVVSGSTPTTNTGPSGDRTTGSGKYFLAEASGHTGEVSMLKSPSISISGSTSVTLDFWYHMYGSGMGSLSVDLYVNGSLEVANIWIRSGQQSLDGSDWKNAVIDLTPYLPASTIQLVFRATIGSELSDIAIDDVVVLSVASALPQSPLVLVDPVGCTVEEGKSIYLSVIPEGFPAPQIQWLKDGVEISGATGASFYIASADTSAEGAYSASVSNSEGTVFTTEAALEPPPPPPPDGIPGEAFIAWTASASLAAEDSGQTADPDLDGVINLFEFAFGFSPNEAADFANLPYLSFHVESGETYLQITYRRRTGDTTTGTTGIDYTVDDITYTVETSVDMDPNGWLSGAGVVAAVGLPVDNGDGTETVTVRRVAALGSGKAFLRVSVDAGW